MRIVDLQVQAPVGGRVAASESRTVVAARGHIDPAVVLSARELNRSLKIISRATHATSVAKLKLAGADNVIMPDSIGGTHMASLVANPDVVEFLDSIRSQGNEGVNIESIAFNELPTEYQFKKLRDLKVLKIRTITSVTIIGYKTAGGNYIINPTGEEEIVPVPPN